jgi:serine/threonine-protein kinase RsbW
MRRETTENIEKEGTVTSDPITLEIPSSSEYVLLGRLVVTQMGQIAGFGPEDIYDLKLAITEAITNAIRHARVDTIRIEYRARPSEVEIIVVDAGDGFDVENTNSDELGGFGLDVIRNLVDEVALESGDSGTSLKMFRRVSPLV